MSLGERMTTTKRDPEDHRKHTRKRTYHGLSKCSFYKVWGSMIMRCTMPWRHDYKYYGGRGIKVCDRWLESASNFLEDMGDRPNKDYELDRINPDGDYDKDNCRWIHTSENKQRQRHYNIGTESVLGYVRVKKNLLCEECKKKIQNVTT